MRDSRSAKKAKSMKGVRPTRRTNYDVGLNREVDAAKRAINAGRWPTATRYLLSQPQERDDEVSPESKSRWWHVHRRLLRLDGDLHLAGPVLSRTLFTHRALIARASLAPSPPGTMRLAHVFHTVCPDYNPLHVVRNRNDFQVSRMPISFRPQFLHHPNELLIIPRNKCAAPIQTRLLWRCSAGPVGPAICHLQ